ncbi:MULTISPECIES: hypothetical protein [Janthinobacterium]|uniref:Uncharacterized protein n=1 Tax=Janthinobacterium violaceinigrum TaxID=2654252 RepID=A0A6I1IAE1_9BURK|nr:MULTISPECIES: hypothetical protein [Janthinobacterium]KAB8066699.1 hypothetical protein GCN75_00025 [Janthinobacterium violaceinigrum]MCX7290326.1 hypothetical protein [Janthinobacterium sp.]MED5595708.1 hypothetical protein [Janthinobacterium sp. P210006]
MKKLYAISALALTALLAGCGGGGSSSHGGDNGGVNPPPVVLLDAFYVAVSNVILTTSDDKDGVAIDAIMATSPENTEPVPL